MNIFNNLRATPFAQVIPVNVKNSFSDIAQQYSKITALVIIVIGAFVAACYIARKYRETPKSEDSKIPNQIIVDPPKHKTSKITKVTTPITTEPDKIIPTTPIKKPEPSIILDENLKKPKDDQKPKDKKDQNSVIPEPQIGTKDLNEWELAFQAAEDAEREEERNLEQALKASLEDVRLKASQVVPDVVVDTPLVSSIVRKAEENSSSDSDDSDQPITEPDNTVLDEGIYSPAKTDEPQFIAEPKQIVPQAPFSYIADEIFDQVGNNIFTHSHFSAKACFKGIDHKSSQQILDILNEIVDAFEKKYHSRNLIAYGKQVPAYFAQVEEASDEERKYLSLVGIRNMLLAGPSIIDDFKDQNFLGGAHHYGSDKGLNAFKYYTGTVVDLDTEIKAGSDAEALEEAKKLIVNFGKICGLKSHRGDLTADEVARQLPNRKLNLPNSWAPDIHRSDSNTDRSNQGIWKRQNPKGTETFYYVNVPNCQLVLSATLRLPYMLAEVAYRAKMQNDGTLSEEFLDDFFENGISTMCFNDKFRTFHQFHLNWMAKFDGGESPEETARANIAKGKFGEYLRTKGADFALKNATKGLNGFLDLLGDVDFSAAENASQWLKNNMDTYIQKLKEKDLWEKTLYQSDEENDYFLLDKSTFINFVKNNFEKIRYL